MIHLRGIIHLTAVIKTRISPYIGIELGQIGWGRFEGRATIYNIILRLDTTGNVTVSKLRAPSYTTFLWTEGRNHQSSFAWRINWPKKKALQCESNPSKQAKTLWGRMGDYRSLHSIGRQTSQTTLDGLFVCLVSFVLKATEENQ